MRYLARRDMNSREAVIWAVYLILAIEIHARFMRAYWRSKHSSRQRGGD